MKACPALFRKGFCGLALAVLGCAPGIASAARLGGGEPLDISWGRIVAALFLSLLVAIVAILLIRKRGGSVKLPFLLGRMELRTRAIHVVETRRLSQHADICLVRHGDCEYLLLLLAGGARILSRKLIEAAPEAEEAP
jgi:hypothetical protein